MELNAREKILTLKVVYYGPALGGKTTNLLTIHALTDKEKKTELISIATRDDRTLFFDLLPMGLGRFFGYELKLKLYTVPGQVQFDVTRRRVLAGADAVVFVADSQSTQVASNALSLKNLRINMNQNRLDPKTTPVVLQYNKRDLPGPMPVEEMNAALNEELRVPSFGAVATSGQGVMECLGSAVARAAEGIAAGRALAQPAEARRAAVGIQSALVAFAPKPGGGLGDPGKGGGPSRAGASGTAGAARTGAPGAPAAPGAAGGPANASGEAGNWIHRADVKVSDDVDLLDEAVKANLALSERLANARLGSDRAGRREQQIRALGIIARMTDEMADPAKVELELLTVSLQAMGLSRGSLLSKPPSGALAVRCLAGHAADPFAAIPSPPLGSLAERLIATGRVALTNDVLGEVLFGEPHAALTGVMGLLFSPVRLADGSFGGLFLYAVGTNDSFDTQDEVFVDAAARIASLARLRAHAPATAR